MDRDELRDLLKRCTTECLTYSREFLIDRLPDDVIYWLYANQSYDGHPPEPDEVLYPEDSLGRHQRRELDDDGVVRFLWREGRVPEWVDMTVVDVDDDHTFIELLCCGRFTANRQRLYYERQGRGPFGVKGPYLPPSFRESGEKPFRLRRGKAGIYPPPGQGKS